MEREGAHACREELHVAVEQREEGAAGPRPHAACDLLGREGRKGGAAANPRRWLQSGEVHDPIGLSQSFIFFPAIRYTLSLPAGDTSNRTPPSSELKKRWLGAPI